LLIDTEDNVGRYIESLNNQRQDHSQDHDALYPQDEHGGFYWGMRNIYVVNTRKSIEHSLASVLRLYHGKVSRVGPLLLPPAPLTLVILLC
jgi:hypothetical protein